jgi:hypothetical protein
MIFIFCKHWPMSELLKAKIAAFLQVLRCGPPPAPLYFYAINAPLKGSEQQGSPI